MTQAGREEKAWSQGTGELPDAQAQGSNEQWRESVIPRRERWHHQGKVSAMLENIKNHFTCQKREVGVHESSEAQNQGGQNCSLFGSAASESARTSAF